MNRYMHEDGLDISLARSFSVMQAMSNQTIKQLGKIFAERPGFREGAFDVEFEKYRAQGGETLYALIVSLGTVMFPNGEIYAPRPLKVRLPLSQGYGDRYLVVRYKSLKEEDAKYADGFGASKDGEYLFQRDGAELILTSTGDQTSISGNELTAYKIRFTPTMFSPDIIDLRASYENYWCAGEYVDPTFTARISDIVHTRVLAYRPPHVDLSALGSRILFNIQSMAGNDEAMIVLGAAMEPLDDTRYALEIKGGSVQSLIPFIFTRSSMLPHPADDRYEYVRIEGYPGVSLYIAIRLRDLYRANVASGWSGNSLVTPGIAPCPPPGGLTILGDWNSYMPIVKIWPLCDSAWPDGSFVQLWGRSSAIAPSALASIEMNPYPLSESPACLAPGQAFFAPINATSFYAKSILVNGANKQVVSGEGEFSAPSVFKSASPKIVTCNFIADNIDEVGLGSTDCMWWHSTDGNRQVCQIENHETSPLYIYRIEFYNQGPAQAADSVNGYLYKVGTGIRLCEIRPDDSGTPYESHWEASIPEQEIAIPQGTVCQFEYHANSGGSSSYCRVQGRLTFFMRARETPW